MEVLKRPELRDHIFKGGEISKDIVGLQNRFSGNVMLQTVNTVHHYVAITIIPYIIPRNSKNGQARLRIGHQDGTLERITASAHFPFFGEESTPLSASASPKHKQILWRFFIMNIRNEIKAQIVRAGYTMQEAVDLLSDEYGWSDSVSNLSAKLQRESIRYKEVAELADVLGYDLVWRKRREV